MIGIFKEINRIFDQAAPATPRVRIMPPGLCATCDRVRDDPMMPPHHASSRCESGMRNHCTCDQCY